MNAGGIIGGILAGIVGAAAWCAVAYYANMEIGYLAWGIGAIVGFAVAAGGKSPGTPSGVLAVVVTILSICAGKYASVEIGIQKALAEFRSSAEFAPEDFEEPAHVGTLAGRIAEDREQQGQNIDWPDYDEDDESVTVEQTYPRDIWLEASKEWNAMSSEQQMELRQQTADNARESFDQVADLFLGEARQGGFLATFGVLDLLFFGLAVATAWGIAVNSGEESSQDVH